MSKFPEILSLVLKRFHVQSGLKTFRDGRRKVTSRKNNASVTFAEALDLRSFVSNDASGAELLPLSNYYLVGLILHEGNTLESGHYVNTIKFVPYPHLKFVCFLIYTEPMANGSFLMIVGLPVR